MNDHEQFSTSASFQRHIPERHGGTDENATSQKPQTGTDGDARHDALSEGRDIDRRSFLGLMGASIALAGMTGCRRPEEHIVPYVSRPENVTLGIAKRYATSMPLGMESYSVLVHSHEGRPTHVAGNPSNPASLGSTNPWISASVLDMYDPDRSLTVRSRGAAKSLAAFTAMWQAAHADFLRTEGEGLAILSESYASPTIDRMRRTFADTFPKALWQVWDPVSDETIHRGIALATGREAQPVHDFTRARVVCSLDADFLGTESRQLANARGFTAARDVRQPQDRMNRLYLVESALSQTAALADHRLRIQSRLVPSFAVALALELRAQGLGLAGLDLSGPPPHPFDTAWIRALAADLLSSRGASLILAGRRQPPALHALVAVLNEALGNAGATVTYASLPHAAPSRLEQLSTLVAAMTRKQVKTLVVIGGNPAYNAPADVDFPGALEGVPMTIHVGAYQDETARTAAWHVPLHHYLESWGDVSSIDGHLGVIQPLIAPLGDGLSVVELCALLATGKPAKGYDIVLDTWKSLLGADGFDDAFARVLRDGVFPQNITAVPGRVDAAAVSRAITAAAFPREAATSDAMEIVFQLAPGVHDGRFANNGWLQEVPDPVTKVTWDNAAVMSQSTADAMGFSNTDIVRLSLHGREIGLPVLVMPGQADNSISVLLGYGRSASGRIGSGVGVSAYRLRTSAAPDIDVGLVVEPIRGTHAFACVQHHHGLDGETIARWGVTQRLPQIVREATIAEYRAEPHFAKERVDHPPLRSMWTDHMYTTGHQWGMTIDLNACIGCGACTIACQSENNIPIVGRDQVLNGREMHWIRVDRYFSGTIDAPAVHVQPVGCQQCEMAPCEQVCPVGATSHDEEGLNVMAYNRCVGTRYCSNNCPYKARRFNFFNYTADMPDTLQMAQNPEVTVRFRGVMEKCTYCTQRLNLAKIAARRDGRALTDGDVQSACQAACPTGAIVFGDILDPRSAVAETKGRDREYQLLGELNVRPRTTYLARLRNPNPDIPERR